MVSADCAPMPASVRSAKKLSSVRATSTAAVHGDGRGDEASGPAFGWLVRRQRIDSLMAALYSRLAARPDHDQEPNCGAQPGEEPDQPRQLIGGRPLRIKSRLPAAASGEQEAQQGQP